jgi:tRNA modification GTPase
MSAEPQQNETIAAVSTPPGRGGIGVVRLSGPQAASIAAQLVLLKRPLEHGRVRLGEILDLSTEPPERIDEALVTWFQAPHSYTGEDVVEIAAHGSPVVLEFILSRALELGARLAGPGEFTQRAFLAGRIDLTQAEAVRDLIDAQTVEQARAAASQLGGSLSRRVAPVKQGLVDMVALLEAGIDFAEDDVEVTPAAEILARIAAVETPLTALAASFRRGHLLHDGLTLAIVGRPNVGKSSLFNRLVERERAIVTATPGTTRDTVTERIALDGIPLELVDTAGLRETAEEAEALGVERSRESMAEAGLVLLVVEAGRPLDADERALVASLEGRPALVAVNKCDLTAANKSDLATAAGPEPSLELVQLGHQARTSAVTGEGIAELKTRIVELATGGAAAEPGMLTNLRQRQAITTALEALEAARKAARSAIPHEMILLDLYRGLWALDSLTGQTTADDILNRIFSTFCIGK